MKKKGLKYWLSIISAACCIVYLLLRIFGIIDNRMHFTSRYHAYAADSSWDTRILSPQETIGLYGNQIQLTYTGIDEIDHLLPLQLIGLWDTPNYWPTLSSDSRLFPSGPGGSWDSNFNALWFYPSLTQQYIDAWTSDLNRAPFLIYGAKIPFFNTTNSLAHPNISFQIDFNYNLDIIQYDQFILFGRDTEEKHPGWSYVLSDFTGLTASNIQKMINEMDGSAHGQSVVTPFPSYVDSEAGVNMGMIHINYGSLLASDTWRYSGQDFYLNGCDTYSSLSEGSWFLVYIQCPQMTSNYFPPIPQTTEPIVTTRPDFTTPLFTYDLSPLETNQLNQIRIQNEQLQVEYAQLQGINYICWKLDQIYNEMVDRGEIPVNFIQAQTLPRDSDIQDFISHQTSFTLAQLPPDEYFDNADTLTDLMREFTNRFSWFYILGMFSLAMCVVCWIIFKGRG